MSDAPTQPTPSPSPPTSRDGVVLAGAGRMSGGAITSLVLGVLGFCTGGLAGLVGLIFGIVSLSKIRRSNGALRGTGLAIAGIVTSAVSLPTACLSVGLFLPALAKARLNAKELRLQSQAVRLADAALSYAADSGGTLAIDDWEKTLVGGS